MTMQIIYSGPSAQRLLVNFATGESIAVMTANEAVTVADEVGTELTAAGYGHPNTITEEEI